MKTKYYFQSIDDEICHSEEYWQLYMESEELSEIDVFEAVPEKFYDMFWCRYHSTVGEKDNQTCGRICKHYSPRNGKNGCCKHYSTQMFAHGEKATLRLSKKQ